MSELLRALKPGLSSLSSSCRAPGLLQPLLAGLGDQWVTPSGPRLSGLGTFSCWILKMVWFFTSRKASFPPPGSETTDGG